MRFVSLFCTLLILHGVGFCQVALPNAPGEYTGAVTEKLKNKNIELSDESLRTALKNPDSSIRDLAFAQLAFTNGKAALPALRAAFEKESVPTVRLNMAMELAYAGDTVGLASLRSSCADQSLPAQLQMRAVRYMIRLKEIRSDEQCIGALIPHFSSDDETVRSNAYSVLAMLDFISASNRKKIGNQLSRGLSDTSAIVRKADSDAIAAIGNEDEIAKLEIAIRQEKDEFFRSAMERNLTKSKARVGNLRPANR